MKKVVIIICDDPKENCESCKRLGIDVPKIQCYEAEKDLAEIYIALASIRGDVKMNRHPEVLRCKASIDSQQLRKGATNE